MLCEWSRKLAPPSKPIRYKTKTNCDLVTRVFLRLRPNMRLLRFLIGSLWFFLCSDWPLWLLLFWFNGTQSKSPLSSTLIRTQTGYNPYVMKSYVILMFGWSVRSSRSIKKNNYIIFESRQKKLNFHLTLFYGNQSLNQANMTKFLGVYVDKYQTWKHHISFICKHISKSVGIISRSRFYLLRANLYLHHLL